MVDEAVLVECIEKREADIKRLQRELSDTRIAKLEANVKEANTAVRLAECEMALKASGIRAAPSVIADILKNTGGGA